MWLGVQVLLGGSRNQHPLMNEETLFKHKLNTSRRNAICITY